MREKTKAKELCLLLSLSSSQIASRVNKEPSSSPASIIAARRRCSSPTTATTTGTHIGVSGKYHFGHSKPKVKHASAVSVADNNAREMAQERSVGNEQRKQHKLEQGQITSGDLHSKHKLLFRLHQDIRQDCVESKQHSAEANSTRRIEMILGKCRSKQL